MEKRNARSTGAQKEELAAKYLTGQGFHVRTRNFKSRQGEIDIVGTDGEYLVFVEVKYRAGMRAGTPLEAVDLRKQRRICRTADYYRLRFGFAQDTPVRYDVVGILGDEIVWIRNAFSHIY